MPRPAVVLPLALPSMWVLRELPKEGAEAALTLACDFLARFPGV